MRTDPTAICKGVRRSSSSEEDEPRHGLVGVHTHIHMCTFDLLEKNV
jgi:hypothetical protein